jgi:hypothetical protein
MGPHQQGYPPWELRPTQPTHHAYSVPVNAERPELISQRSMIGFIVAIVGFALAFGGTLVWRAHAAHSHAPIVATMAIEPSPVEASAPLDFPSAFEPPPPTIALSASVGEPSPPPPAKVEKRRKAKAEGAKAAHASAIDGSVVASADGVTRKHGRKPRRITAD